MRRLLQAAAAILLPFHLNSPAAAQDNALQQAFSTPVIVARGAPTTSIPLDVRGRKLHLTASVMGVEREFIFDTGSPTVLSADLAARLDLEIIGQNTGVDANGTAVTMKVAVVDEIALGDVSFRKVPVLIHDYAQTPQGGCFIDGGVLGSELLPGSAWRVDLSRAQLDIASTAGDLGVSPDAGRATMYDFGYPHMPVVDYSVNGFRDKALFDTGNAAAVVLFDPIVSDRQVRRATARGSMREGRGTLGVSAGGMGAEIDLRRFSLTDFRVGAVQLAPVETATRNAPPTLIGAGVLDAYVVTLDYPAGVIWWEPRAAPAPRPPHRGFAVMFVDDAATVVQLYENSPADRAGLRLGDRVLALSGRSLAASDEAAQCAQARWLAERAGEERPATITVLRGDAAVELQLE